MSPTHTETLAVEALYGTGEDTPGLLNRLLTLTSGEPTTEELKEALGLISLEIPAVLKAWISSRNIINGRQTMTGPKAEALARALNSLPCACGEDCVHPSHRRPILVATHPAAGLIPAFQKDIAS
jgi:hypothetical protein